MNKPLLEVRNLQVHFPVKSSIFQRAKTFVKAVDDVSFDVNERETLGIVGESGCGKSTTGRAVLQLIPPTSGLVHFEGKSLIGLKSHELRKKRQNMQMVFQDPYSSLNPRLTVERILAEPLQAHGIGSHEERRSQILEVMDLCGLSSTYINRYAHEFSGGQRQRICIARALILRPKLIVADEPVSALDVSIQSQILNLMQDLQRELGLTYLFISHDLAVVRHLCTRVGVMYLGRMAEIAPVESLYETPLHPYTQTLLSAIPKGSPREVKERIILQGEVPSPLNPPSGCAFSTRCPHVMDRCRTVRPELQEVGGASHQVACHLYDEE
ncbi:ABC transporter ATP-binding protein [Paenibacillus sp. MAH-36]|uniref:Dipeptide ABC transporter ATP-binding protein n=1 Tax=Paenibacillus violae TaxID=3077234 RepID=A0ABU3RKP0_9BACL|nr:dipeptide ABC transporter ATP-binding protein [Paenibacillus sp. PFR10]MDU0204861.1 dipeptide ABC transporter ATP-binding protein [Paenibacillus sp. PFR10]